jgi:hypothetical protein
MHEARTSRYQSDQMTLTESPRLYLFFQMAVQNVLGVIHCAQVSDDNNNAKTNLDSGTTARN